MSCEDPLIGYKETRNALLATPQLVGSVITQLINPDCTTSHPRLPSSPSSTGYFSRYGFHGIEQVTPLTRSISSYPFEVERAFSCAALYTPFSALEKQKNTQSSNRHHQVDRGTDAETVLAWHPKLGTSHTPAEILPLTQQLASALGNVCLTDDHLCPPFAFGGFAEDSDRQRYLEVLDSLRLPALSSDSNSGLGKSLSGSQIDQLASLCSAAPFGDLRSRSTRQDSRVRRALELSLDNSTFPLQRIVQRQFNEDEIFEHLRHKELSYHCEPSKLVHPPELVDYSWERLPDDLHLTRVLRQQFRVPLKLQPYKLNLYRQADFFAPHVDTPSPTECSLGTLLIALPSSHQGGQLLVRHHGQQIQFGFSDTEPEATRVEFAAFYTDCEHEVQPVQSGWRVTLSYKIVLDRSALSFVDNSFSSSSALPPPKKQRIRQRLHSSALDICEKFVRHSVSGLQAHFAPALKKKHYAISLVDSSKDHNKRKTRKKKQSTPKGPFDANFTIRLVKSQLKSLAQAGTFYFGLLLSHHYPIGPLERALRQDHHDNFQMFLSLLRGFDVAPIRHLLQQHSSSISDVHVMPVLRRSFRTQHSLDSECSYMEVRDRLLLFREKMEPLPLLDHQRFPIPIIALGIPPADDLLKSDHNDGRRYTGNEYKYGFELESQMHFAVVVIFLLNSSLGLTPDQLVSLPDPFLDIGDVPSSPDTQSEDSD